MAVQWTDLPPKAMMNTTTGLSENTLNYNQNFGDHSLSLLGGFIASRESDRGLYISSHGFGGSTAITTVTGGTVQSCTGHFNL